LIEFLAAVHMRWFELKPRCELLDWITWIT